MTTESNRPSTGPSSTIATITLLIVLAGFLYLSGRLQTIEKRLQPFLDSRTLYVPASSHVYSQGGQPLLLEVTLIVRNTDPKTNLTLTRADYYDTKGEQLRRYVTAPRQLTPLQSVSFVVEKTDYKGGSGANFIVEWDADVPIARPVVEATMIGADREYQISFVRDGVPMTGFER